MVRRVLIVDDFEYNLEFEEKVIKSLTKEGNVSIHVDVALNVAEALTKISQNAVYDAMVIDMNLPDGSGSAIAKEALKKNKTTKIAALTLYPEEYENSHALFDLFLRKPIMPMDYKKNFKQLLNLEG
ncbi:response regulator [Sulfurovum sp.]|uniref:response regulator n=1 Tax=Sulfurovum sp. TaxID=1969726 RepID=UPI0025CD8675|nr:response regulator [Sulfurovum sp.]